MAIREKLSLWPVIPLSFIMKFFSLHLTHLTPGSVRNEAPDQRDFRGSGCTESSETQNEECCRCKSKSNTIRTFSSMKYHPCILVTLLAAADRGDLHVPLGSHSLRVFQPLPLQSTAFPALFSSTSQHAGMGKAVLAGSSFDRLQSWEPSCCCS